MAVLTKSEIAALSVDERLALIDDLWLSFGESQEALSPPDWHRQALDEILDEDEQSPQPTSSWEETKSELAKQWLS
jgi:putative addiction module component (TIGR02574 family)